MALFQARELHGRCFVDRQTDRQAGRQHAGRLADQPTRRSSISTSGAEGGWPATWITTADPTPNAAGSSPCTLHSAVDQGVCVPSASAPMGMLFLLAAVAECDTSDSIDAVVNCCGLWVEAKQQQGATRGVLQEAAKRAWHPQVGFHFHCATAAQASWLSAI
jgi:hypothetical protein